MPGGGGEGVGASGTHGCQELPVTPARRGAQDELRGKVDDVHRAPALLGEVDKPGAAVEQGGQQGHGPGAAESLYIIKRKAHRKGEDGRGGIAKAVGKAQLNKIPAKGSQQGGRPAGTGARCPHQSDPKRGVFFKYCRSRQYRGEQKMDACLAPAQQRRGVHRHRAPPVLSASAVC